jgi:hypothetical protein
MSRAARFVPVLALAFALTLGVWILFGPTYTTCTSGPITPESPTFVGPGECHSASLVQTQPIFPAPFLWIAAWSLAPALAVIGTRSGSQRTATGLTLVALAIDGMSIISMGGGFLYAIFVTPMLLLTLILIASGRRDSPQTSLG